MVAHRAWVDFQYPSGVSNAAAVQYLSVNLRFNTWLMTIVGVGKLKAFAANIATPALRPVPAFTVLLQIIRPAMWTSSILFVYHLFSVKILQTTLTVHHQMNIP
jgi:hypothetical protein